MSTAGDNHGGRTGRLRPRARVALDTIGPPEIDGAQVLLRRPRLSDGPAWRAARRRDAGRLQAAFGDDSSLTTWADHVLADRRPIRAGTLVPFIAVGDDGRVLGECSFAIDPRSGLAEASIWAASDATAAMTTWMLLSGTLRMLELRQHVPWVTAPVAVGNRGPVRLLDACGFEVVAVARQLRTYDGVPTDHQIWRLENTSANREMLRRLAGS